MEKPYAVINHEMNDYIAYAKTLRYRMRMKKRPIRGKDVLNRLNKK